MARVLLTGKHSRIHTTEICGFDYCKIDLINKREEYNAPSFAPTSNWRQQKIRRAQGPPGELRTTAKSMRRSEDPAAGSSLQAM